MTEPVHNTETVGAAETAAYGGVAASAGVPVAGAQNGGESTQSGGGSVDEATRFVKVEKFGALWRIRKPQQAAVSAVMFGTSRYAPEQVQMDSMMRFLTRHMHEDDLSEMLERMSDPDDADLGHGIEGMSELFQEIIRLVEVPDDK